jgi:hypothetical protein
LAKSKTATPVIPKVKSNDDEATKQSTTKERRKRKRDATPFTAKQKRKPTAESHKQTTTPGKHKRKRKRSDDDDDGGDEDSDSDDDEETDSDDTPPPSKKKRKIIKSTRKKRNKKPDANKHDQQTKLASLVVKPKNKKQNDDEESDSEEYDDVVEGSAKFEQLKEEIWKTCGIGDRGEAWQIPLFTIGTKLGINYGQREKTPVFVDFLTDQALDRPNVDLPQAGVLSLTVSKTELEQMKKIDWTSMNLQAYKGQHMCAAVQRAARQSQVVRGVWF